jgi:hypothetical protein
MVDGDGDEDEELGPWGLGGNPGLSMFLIGGVRLLGSNLDLSGREVCIGVENGNGDGIVVAVVVAAVVLHVYLVVERGVPR